jgi:two-component system, cell cycle sensor histidine kinase and response regulator CckA
MSTDLHPVTLPSSAQDVLVSLVRLSIAADGSDGAHILQRLTELAALGLGVERASVWLRDEAQDAIVCQDLFDGGAVHQRGVVLQRKDFPPYFAMLDQSVVIPAEDAHRHPATACFSAAYLTPLGIGAMLDAPIWRGGKAVGVLCLEQVGGKRAWTESDCAFATQVALICGLYYERQERLAAERALREHEANERHDQKMEALGRMACAIGHDFNNLLTTIVGQTEMLRRPESSAEQVRERAGTVLDAAERAAALVRRLLNFGKGRDATVAEIDLAAVTGSLQSVLRGTVPKRIFLDLRLPERQVRVMGDTVSIEQVVMNLVVNARDSISDYGTITVTVQHGIDDDGTPLAVLKVSDTGCGMDQATLARAFDPFYTTKGDRGTGLGLSTCFGNMRRMGGRINITSNPGQGTTCVCTFPTR